MPKVSVIIPAYNAMEYLPGTVENVLSQTFIDFELIIVNDGGSDNINQWVSQLTEPRVKCISQENHGAPIARNTGIAAAQGEYIALMDSDDLWDHTKLAKQVHYLDNHPPEVGVVYTWTGLIDNQGKSLGRVWASNAEGNVWEQLAVRDNMLASGSVAMVRQSCFEKVGGFDPNLKGFQDWDMWVRLAYHYHFGVIKEVLTFHRQHSLSMSKSRSLEATRLASIEVIEKTFCMAPAKFLNLKRKSYCCHYLSLGWNYIDQGNPIEAMRNLWNALSQYPQICFSEYCFRLILATILTAIFGPNGYTGVRSMTHILRLALLNTKPNTPSSKVL